MRSFREIRGERQRQHRIESLEAERQTLESKLAYVNMELDSLYANPALGRVYVPHLRLVPDLVELEVE